ncbi:MAG: 50S ribosomal protein L23 [Dehalococcoidia bacterium]|nr:50S ribosomal protein L23 [Dehalococcoidia bacterium]
MLLRPVVTENSTRLQGQGKYVFEVARTATKGGIKEAVEKTFGVKVTAVNTLRGTIKTKRFGKREVYGRTWKKAIVTLAPGDKIALFEGI